jgi:cell division protease FtsH
MTRWYHRHLRLLHRLFWLALGVVTVTVIIATVFGVSSDGSSAAQTYSPGSALRNFFGIFPSVVKTSIGWASQWVWLIFVNLLGFVAIFWFMAKGTTQLLRPGQYHVTFDDVRGQPEIVGSVRQVMHIFQGHRVFKKQFGGYPPRGLLFEGPPGTGKTLLAKAIAGESGVPFLYASGAGFANMFLGIPQLKLRTMFKKARKLADKWGGCVIFIDELDAIGGSRTGVSNARMANARVDGFVMPGMGGGDSMLVNGLLTEMDGIEKPGFLVGMLFRFIRKPAPAKASNLLVIGATNRAATLDAALLRPGRFDRKIHIGNPSESGRRDIIAYYLNKVAHVPIDIDRLAKATRGSSPARIKTIINEGLIFAHREGRDALTYDDIWQAKLHDEIGLVEPVVYSDKEKYATAVHEAGHAVVMHYLRPNRPVQIVTVRKRGSTLGLVHSQEEEERFSTNKSDLIADIKVSLAGMVAEEMWLGESTSGPSSDLANATGNAVRMVAQYGMGSTLVSHTLLDGRQTFNDSFTLALNDPEVRKEVDSILQECKVETREFLERHRRDIEVTAKALVDDDELTGDQFRDLLYRNGLIPKPPATQAALPIQPPLHLTVVPPAQEIAGRTEP